LATVKGEVKGGGEKQFELLLVLIDDLEEPSDVSGFEVQKYVHNLPTLCSYFGAMVQMS
jgi:hypothetical protein